MSRNQERAVERLQNRARRKADRTARDLAPTLISTPETKALEPAVRRWLFDHQTHPLTAGPPEVYVYADMLQQAGDPRGLRLARRLRDVEHLRSTAQPGLLNPTDIQTTWREEDRAEKEALARAYPALSLTRDVCGFPTCLVIPEDQATRRSWRGQIRKLVARRESVMLSGLRCERQDGTANAAQDLADITTQILEADFRCDLQHTHDLWRQVKRVQHMSVLLCGVFEPLPFYEDLVSLDFVEVRMTGEVRLSDLNLIQLILDRWPRAPSNLRSLSLTLLTQAYLSEENLRIREARADYALRSKIPWFCQYLEDGGTFTVR